jgi:HlyD family secretion protein
MTLKKKLLFSGILVVAAAAGAGYYFKFVKDKGVITVESGKVIRQDLTQSVSSNGEIKPKKSVNISSNAMGRIINMPVREGDHVKEGALLIRLESIQTEADVKSAEAMLDAAQSETEGMAAQLRASEAAVNSAKADIKRAEADAARAKQSFDRNEKLLRDGLISPDSFEKFKSDYDIALITLNAANARLAQSEAQVAQVKNQGEQSTIRIAQQRSSLVRAKDSLSKTTITSPLDGIITYLPVNEGEIAIIGIQNSPGTVLMTIADLSVITAEVRVDETDIVNVRIGQEAKIKVDALGDKFLMGHVSEVGNSALNKSGTAAGNNNNGGTQEAKDFKVVIILDDPPKELRPGLSCTATIITATAKQVLSIPIQALTIREFDNPDKSIKKKIEKEGVFTIKNGVAMFHPVKTGITGTTDIEILEGLTTEDEIVSGPYQVLRTIQDNAKVKIEKPADNAEKKP